MAANLAKKALTAAGVLLGVQAVAKAVMPGTAKAVDESAARVVRHAARKGGQYARAAERTAEKAAETVAELPGKLASGAKWVAAGLAAAFLLPKLLSR